MSHGGSKRERVLISRLLCVRVLVGGCVRVWLVSSSCAGSEG